MLFPLCFTLLSEDSIYNSSAIQYFQILGLIIPLVELQHVIKDSMNLEDGTLLSFSKHILFSSACYYIII